MGRRCEMLVARRSPARGASIENCGFEGDVATSATGNTYAGGLAGYFVGTSGTRSSITSSYFKGGVQNGGSYFGGIAAYLSYTDVTNCYASGGTLTGSGTSTSVGGIAGRVSNSTATSCYSTLDMADVGTSTVHALFGTATSATAVLTNAYYLDNIGLIADSGVSTSTAKTAAELKDSTFVATLNGSDSVWQADGTGDAAINDGYPILAWQRIAPTNFSELSFAIAQAEGTADIALSDIIIQKDGSTVPEGQKWTTQAALDDLSLAIEAAQEVRDYALSSQAEVNAALSALKVAVAAFGESIKTGSYVPLPPTDFSALIASLTTAQTAANIQAAGIALSADGADVYPEQNWTTQEALDTLHTAIQTAQTTANNQSAAQADIDTADMTLRAAIQTFNDTLKPGTKVKLPKDVPPVRLAGTDRHETMRQIVSEGFSQDDTDTVVIAKSTDFPDALSVAGLAGIYDAPILITTPEGLTPQAKSTLEDLKPSKIYTMGDSASITEATRAEIVSLTGITPVSLAGADRYATALASYAEGKGNWSDVAIIANGKNYPDALSAAPFAYATKSPILLSDPVSGLSDASIYALKDGGFKRVYLLGGDNAVPKAVQTQLASIGLSNYVCITDVSSLASSDTHDVVRLEGAHRYQTSVLVAEEGARASLQMSAALSYDNSVIAKGTDFPDALAGGALAGRLHSTLILVSPATAKVNGVMQEVAEGDYILDNYLLLHKQEIGRLFMLGDATSIPEDLHARIEQLIQN